MLAQVFRLNERLSCVYEQCDTSESSCMGCLMAQASALQDMKGHGLKLKS